MLNQDEGFLRNLNFDDLNKIIQGSSFVMDDCMRANLQTLFNLEQKDVVSSSEIKHAKDEILTIKNIETSKEFKEKDLCNSNEINEKSIENLFKSNNNDLDDIKKNLKNFSTEPDAFSDMKSFFLNKKRNLLPSFPLTTLKEDSKSSFLKPMQAKFSLSNFNITNTNNNIIFNTVQSSSNLKTIKNDKSSSYKIDRNILNVTNKKKKKLKFKVIKDKIIKPIKTEEQIRAEKIASKY